MLDSDWDDGDAAPQHGHAKSNLGVQRAASPHVGTAVVSQSKRLQVVAATTKPAPNVAVCQVGNGSGSRKTPSPKAPKPAPTARQRRITILAAKPNISESALPPVPRRHRNTVGTRGSGPQRALGPGLPHCRIFRVGTECSGMEPA